MKKRTRRCRLSAPKRASSLNADDDLREYMTPEQAFIELRNRGYSKADIDFIKKQINHGVIIAQNQKGASTGQA
jgi:hypothetical protein